MYSFQNLLDGLDGIAYVVDCGYVIRACGSRNWDRFLDENGGPATFDSSHVIGRSLFDFIVGEDVAGRYRRWLERLPAEDAGPVTFAFRCDSPECRRDLRMSISRLGADEAPNGFLFHSTVLEQTQRPPLNIYDFEAQIAAFEAGKRFPLIRMCSFCQRVHWAGERGPEWLAPEIYYQRGGGSEVRISHGMCPDCAARLPNWDDDPVHVSEPCAGWQGSPRATD